MRSLLLIIAVAAAAAGLFYLGWTPRQQRIQAVTSESSQEQRELLGVSVRQARISDAPPTLTLPATVGGIRDTPIYARAEGYVKKLHVDIGDYVKLGQVLMEIDSPEQDQQLLNARSRLDQLKATLLQTQAAEQVSRANLKLATVTQGRVTELVRQGVTSKQQGDEAQAQLEARQADVAVQEANVNVARQNIKAQDAEVARLEQLTRYQKVTAPFEGLITVRNVAVGNLITPQSIQGGRELYRLTDITSLRVFANTPQANVADITVGQRAIVTTQDQPDKKFIGIVRRTSNLLDPQTRTLLTEINVPNQGRSLLPGMYAQVTLDVARVARTAVLIPGDTLVTTSKGPQVATVGANGAVHWVPVTIGRDLGADVEITSGLRGTESLVVNPSDDVREGRRVKSSRVK